MIVREMDEATIKQNKPSRAIRFQSIRAIFYRYDYDSMFQKHELLVRAIKHATAVEKFALDALLLDPLATFAGDVDPQTKVNAMKAKYMLAHFKATNSV